MNILSAPRYPQAQIPLIENLVNVTSHEQPHHLVLRHLTSHVSHVIFFHFTCSIRITFPMMLIFHIESMCIHFHGFFVHMIIFT